MKKTKILSILFILCLLVSLIFPITTVYAESKNEVTLNFKGGTIHDGYVEYSKKAKVQLFKGEDLVTNISNNMVIDLNEAEYKFVIEEIEDSSIAVANTSIKLKINNWYYPIIAINETKSTFKLDSSKFNGKLDIEFERRNIAFNSTVKNVYEDISSKGVIDLTNGKEYVIDFSKTDELTEGLKSFADLDKTLYYKRDNKGLLETDNESEAVIKIVGNRSENKAILTAVNVGTKKSEGFKGFHTKYTGSALDYDDLDGSIKLETRYDYYTRCKYEFTFQYVKEEVSPKEYEFTEGANQTYTIDESKDATFRIDADYSLFTNKVYVDDKLIDSTNYDSKTGSTVITLKDEYLKTLSVGEHTLKVAFSDNGEAITKFTIKEKQQNETPEDSKNTGSTENTEKEEQPENNNVTNNDVQKENTNNPKTGDNVIVYAVLFAIALLGIITLIIVNNTKRKNSRKH
jgi:putative uncharacterized protein (fragment)